jgi:uncharacterized protein YwbE
VADKRAAIAERDAHIARLADLYAELRAGNPGSHAVLLAAARALCLRTIVDPDLMVALLSAGPVDAIGHRAADEEPFARQSWNVSVLCVAAGLQLDHGPAQLLELACAGLLHDVTRLGSAGVHPSDADAGPESLRHGLGVLRRFDRLALGAVAVAVAPLGLGPEQGPGHFARLVVACRTFEAMASERAAHGGLDHQVVREAAALASKRELDPAVLRAILTAVSLFPVGSWVRLSEGGVGRVVRAGGPESARPLVWLRDTPAPGALVDLAERSELRLEPIPAAPMVRVDPLVGRRITARRSRAAPPACGARAVLALPAGSRGAGRARYRHRLQPGAR